MKSKYTIKRTDDIYSVWDDINRVTLAYSAHKRLCQTFIRNANKKGFMGSIPRFFAVSAPAINMDAVDV